MYWRIQERSPNKQCKTLSQVHFLRVENSRQATLPIAEARGVHRYQLLLLLIAPF